MGRLDAAYPLAMFAVNETSLIETMRPRIPIFATYTYTQYTRLAS